MMYDELVKQLQYCATHDCMHEGEELVGCTAPIEEREGCCTCNDVLMMQAADAIEELMRRCEQFQYTPPPAWIPVMERLPGEFGRYLCRYRVEEGETIGYCTDFGRYDPEHGEWFVGTVTHWMPLPPAPKEE